VSIPVIMSSPAKIRVRPGPKAKSTALKPRSLTALKLHKAPEIDATEWVPKSKKAKKLRKTFTREFKLRAISLVSSNRMSVQSGSKEPMGIRCK